MERIPQMELPNEVRSGIRQTASLLRGMRLGEFVNKELHEPSLYLLKAPGKMLRPALVFMGARYCGYKSSAPFVQLAMSMELLHISSLIYDDIIDRDVRRRGKSAVHVKFGNERAMLAGNALISKAIEKSAAYGPNVIRQTSNAAMEMCAGEALDYKYQQLRVVPSLKEYLALAELKSASLIAAAASSVPEYKKSRDTPALNKFGRLFGVGFQIRDDAFDFMEGNTRRNNGSRDSFRPNIVRSIQRSVKSRGVALERAVELNNRYIDDALDLIGEGSGGIFSKYAGKVRIGYADLV